MFKIFKSVKKAAPVEEESSEWEEIRQLESKWERDWLREHPSSFYCYPLLTLKSIEQLEQMLEEYKSP